ncbi:pantetheine-phosphate adenylyltransferase [Kocuria indica]|uniref:Phosphopantetheine adenylyltransferase n=1 Tax=Kocuria marina subsp. indica TaxID=1049583 RepID=A0A6N9QZY9_9MICC|nr:MULTISPECIES: pantetheine-phosphate adenylyltransferase [Kocuria]MCT1616180.1 pantetheine-phosphate adenylyltransferase [Kocuria marina]NDO77890.1 pantetheine-phosphate adenylyltransferase [Kocuria indica]
MRRAICPGSFDPLHLGHCAVIHRAARLFDEVIVAVSTNPNKTHRFSEDTRIELVREVFADEPAVVVEPLASGLIADYAERQEAVALVKGLRNGADYDYELPMATMNRSLTGVETVFLPGEPSLLHVSSSLVMEVAALGGDVASFVPDPVLRAIERR